MPGNFCRAAEDDTDGPAFIGLLIRAVDRQVAPSNFEEAQAGSIALAILLYYLQQAAHQRQAQAFQFAAERVRQHDSREGVWIKRGNRVGARRADRSVGTISGIYRSLQEETGRIRIRLS